MKRPRLSFRRFGPSADGIVAVEFAFVVPIMISIFFGGFAVTQSVAISRKVSITTRALADLTTQYSTMSAADVTMVLGAATQIIAPFDATPLSMRLSEITTDATGLKATVQWSRSVGTALPQYLLGAPFVLPASMQYPSTSFIYSETQYTYTPVTKITTGAINISDRIYMLPRLTTSVTYTG